ncbi:MAG TPA: WbqC family protein [Cyclobacteriaceae bacterium]|nr:WbqC family protein [Cyclobacteriaceae bacterium]
MASQVLIDLHFFPSLEYFVLLSDFENIQVEKYEHYVKQSYRNRCFIKTTQGVEMLSVPLTGKHGKVPYGEVRIDYSTRWRDVFWRTVESAYRNSPYYEHYSDDVQKIIYSGTDFIFDLNVQILSFCLKSLKWRKALSATVEYEKTVNEPFFDARSLITTRNTYIVRGFYRSTPYYQVFGSSFDENLSVLDLLFCTGPEAGRVLMASRFNPQNNR